MTEDEVIRHIICFFRRQDYEVIGRCLGKSTGVDVAVRIDGGKLLFIEAKGLTNRANGEPRRAERGRCQVVWDNGYARLPQLAAGRKRIRRMDGKWDEEPTTPDCVGLAVPDNQHFREHFDWFRAHMAQSRFGLWFVARSSVEEALAPGARRR